MYFLSQSIWIWLLLQLIHCVPGWRRRINGAHKSLRKLDCNSIPLHGAVITFWTHNCRMEMKCHVLVMQKSFKIFTMFVWLSIKLHDTFLIFSSRNLFFVKLTLFLAIWDQEISQQASQVDATLNSSLPAELSDLKIISYCFDMFKCAM